IRVYDAALRPGESFAVGETRLRVVPGEGEREVPLHPGYELHGLIGCSAQMRAVIAQVEKLASSPYTVLVQGETGVGKSAVAAALHHAGPRAEAPLVVVDGGALPRTLVEAELFGHEKGAFTGAIASVAGAFERAHGGTLFLDEIGELSIDLQPKLLRALEERKVRRVGGSQDLPFDLRVLAATNRDLETEVGQGTFRQD